MNLILIADIAGFMGMMLFLHATLRQWYKIKKTKHITAISLASYKSRIMAGVCSMICFGLAGLYMSFGVVTIELCISLHITYMLVKYRKLRK